MRSLTATVAAGLLAVAAALAGPAPAPAAVSAAPAASHVTGTLPDGASWVADLPAHWNGTLLLYSHGFGPLTAADAPDPATSAALLARGYALAGSSYDPNGSMWALNSAVRDQFQTLQAVEASVLPGRPQQVLAVGTSMGGLISALEAQDGAGRISGALTTCGIVAGAVNLNNYQLDGEYALAQLLLPGQQVKLVRFTDAGDALATAATLQAAAGQAQQAAAGRARLALAMAFINVPPWAAGQAVPPPPSDPAAQEAAQYQVEFTGSFSTLDFIESGRPSIDQAAGGSASWTRGVDFAAALARSPYLPEVQALYHKAGLNLGADLDTLTRHADITADPGAVTSLEQTSVPTGHLTVPELDLHTISDQLVPVQQENSYAHKVASAGDSPLLRQAYVASVGHCNFSPAELVAGVLAISHRISAGRWDSAASPGSLNQAAGSLGLGPARFTSYNPGPLTGITDAGPPGPRP
ncbi:MAG: alpha/beta hydrolase [Actinobacteria bacterium]|nr:alpha/beta hydrolase [Actinomycetota bacterium]